MSCGATCTGVGTWTTHSPLRRRPSGTWSFNPSYVQGDPVGGSFPSLDPGPVSVGVARRVPESPWRHFTRTRVGETLVAPKTPGRRLPT